MEIGGVNDPSLQPCCFGLLNHISVGSIGYEFIVLSSSHFFLNQLLIHWVPTQILLNDTQFCTRHSQAIHYPRKLRMIKLLRGWHKALSLTITLCILSPIPILCQTCSTKPLSCGDKVHILLPMRTKRATQSTLNYCQRMI